MHLLYYYAKTGLLITLSKKIHLLKNMMNIEFSAKLDTKVVLNRYILEKKGLACFPSGQLFSDLNSTNRCVGKYNIVLYFQFFCRFKKLSNKHISSENIQAKKSNCDRQNQRFDSS